MEEIKLSFDISIALERCDINYLEDELLRKREEVFKQVILTVLRILEGRLIERGIRCSSCDSEMIEKGRNGRKLETLLGEIEFWRKRFKCKGCGREIYPLDGALGLEPQRKCTLGVVERALWAAVEVSYEKSSEFLKKFTGLEVSRGHIHSLAMEEGGMIQAWEEEKARRVFDRGLGVEGVSSSPETLYIQVDGTGINDRDSKQWMECKVGASFSQRVLISKNRFCLLDKRTYASIEDADTFGEKFFLECVRQGVLEAKRVFFIGDGASWIRTLKNDYFPDALGVLDIWHLERALKKVFGEGGSLLVESLIELALKGKGAEILGRLREEAVRLRGERRQKVMELIAYVRNNLDWIENIPLAQGYGSGPVEKTVDITVARRFKKRGMSWYREGANPLLRLRLLKLNGEWDVYWSKRKQSCTRSLAA